MEKKTPENESELADLKKGLAEAVAKIGVLEKEHRSLFLATIDIIHVLNKVSDFKDNQLKINELLLKAREGKPLHLGCLLS